ncbi:F-box/LRR-repeat protein 7-like [Schistocerca americana]|uniref:F-box/LRR-repeat protein 7-like n=1 Tax=Schistocerca americana TaxID=7009 RepID=UPI001F4F5B55|nr:F-box/LRR-repeat protein 7-like [Schistocerca americana]
MYFSNLLITTLYCNSSESDVAVCKCLQVSQAEDCVTSPPSAPPISQRSEERDNSEMTSEVEPSEECKEGSEDVAMCRSSDSSKAPLSSVTSPLESSGTTPDESEVSMTNLDPQQLETNVADTTGNAALDTGSQCLSIDTLPDEILLKIFSHLSFSELVDIQKVSSRWKRLSQDAELWTDKEYEIRSWSDCDSDTCKGGRTDREAIQTFCDVPNLRKVCMRRGAKSGVFRALYNKCQRLSELRLHYTQKLSYSVLKNLVEKCSGIHTLRISNELLKSEKFSEAVSHLKNLRVLDLEEYFSENTPVLRPLGDGCPRLAEVDFGWMTIDMEDLRYFLNAKRNTLKSVRMKWAMVGKRCVLPLLTVCADSLERLQLYEFDIVRDEAREAFTALGSLKNLQELKISLIDPPPPGSAALAFKAGGLPKLRLLDLRESFGVDSDTIIAASRGCPALRELSVRGAELLSDAAFSQIYRLQHLEILDLSCCKGLGGDVIPCLARLPHLHTLSMEEMEFPKLQPGLSSIVELSGLRCLTLNYSLVTGVPFDKFPGKLVNLRELNIQWCRGDPKATEGLTEQMPDLEIHGNIEEEERADDTEGHESDAEVAEEGNEENAGPGDADDVQDGGSENDDSDSDSNSSSDSESDGENLIWGERGISDLFLENMNE